MQLLTSWKLNKLLILKEKLVICHIYKNFKKGYHFVHSLRTVSFHETNTKVGVIYPIYCFQTLQPKILSTKHAYTNIPKKTAQLQMKQ